VASEGQGSKGGPFDVGADEELSETRSNPTEAPGQETVLDAGLPFVEPELPRGATGAELDAIRASLRKSTRQSSPGLQRPSATTPPSALQVRGLGQEVGALIDEGRALLDTDLRAAHSCFERAWLRNTNDARVLSHYGMTLVRAEGDRQRGIRFCEEAVRRNPRSSEFLINLARALLETRNKEHAVRALVKAQSLDPQDAEVQRAFGMLGLRRPPVISFLPRSFILNRWLGMLTWRLSHPAR
jgi:Tetratricopeptide repeat